MSNIIYYVHNTTKIKFFTAEFKRFNSKICRTLNFASLKEPLEYTAIKNDDANLELVCLSGPVCIFQATYSLASACVYICELINQYAGKLGKNITVIETISNIKNIQGQLYQLTKLVNLAAEVLSNYYIILKNLKCDFI